MSPKKRLFLLSRLTELIAETCDYYKTDSGTVKKWIVEEIEKK